MSCKNMPKEWKQTEAEEMHHKFKPCTKGWLKEEKLEDNKHHKGKIGSKKWAKEEMKEVHHKNLNKLLLG